MGSPSPCPYATCEGGRYARPAWSNTSRHSAESLREAVLPRLRDAAAGMAQVPAADVPPASPAPRVMDARVQAGAGAGVRGVARPRARGPDRLQRGPAELPLTAVAEATGLARATAQRSLITLERLDHVASQGRLFRLTPRVLELRFAPCPGLRLPQIAEPHPLENDLHVAARYARVPSPDGCIRQAAGDRPFPRSARCYA